MLTQDKINELKSDFIEWCKEDPALELANGVGSFENIADWFLPKIDELLKSQRDEERLRSAKIVEELMEDSEYWQPIASRIMDRVIIGKEDLSLIKNN